MNTEEDPLKDAFAAWRDIEPAPDFDASVWRAIRAAPARKPGLVEWLVDSFRQEPAWVPAASALAGVLVGITALLPREGNTHRPQQIASLQILGSDSLSGNYIRLASGDHP